MNFLLSFLIVISITSWSPTPADTQLFSMSMIPTGTFQPSTIEAIETPTTTYKVPKPTKEKKPKKTPVPTLTKTPPTITNSPLPTLSPSGTPTQTITPFPTLESTEALDPTLSPTCTPACPFDDPLWPCQEIPCY